MNVYSMRQYVASKYHCIRGKGGYIPVAQAPDEQVIRVYHRLISAKPVAKRVYVEQTERQLEFVF